MILNKSSHGCTNPYRVRFQATAQKLIGTYTVPNPSYMLSIYIVERMLTLSLTIQIGSRVFGVFSHIRILCYNFLSSVCMNTLCAGPAIQENNNSIKEIIVK